MTTIIKFTCQNGGEIRLPITNTMMTIANVAYLLMRKHRVTYRQDISNVTIYTSYNEYLHPELQLYHLVQNQRMINLLYDFN